MDSDWLIIAYSTSEYREEIPVQLCVEKQVVFVKVRVEMMKRKDIYNKVLQTRALAELASLTLNLVVPHQLRELRPRARELCAAQVLSQHFPQVQPLPRGPAPCPDAQRRGAGGEHLHLLQGHVRLLIQGFLTILSQ